MFGRQRQVAFVLTILVVNHDDHAAGLDLLDGTRHIRHGTVRLHGSILRYLPRFRVDSHPGGSERVTGSRPFFATGSRDEQLTRLAAPLVSWSFLSEDSVLQRACCLLFLLVGVAAAQTAAPVWHLPAPPPSHWPIKDGSYSIPNFRFGTGETL